MQINPAQTHPTFVAENPDTAFDSVWGNAMQREDFLALAAGVRQFSLEMADLAFVSRVQPFAEVQAHAVAE